MVIFAKQPDKTFLDWCENKWIKYLNSKININRIFLSYTVISRLSLYPFKFASRLSLQKFFKKSRFNFYKNILIFTTNQRSHKNVHNLDKT